jgi:hypothetical protein
MLVQVDSRDSQTVTDKLIKHERKLPQELYQSLTWERRPEMAQHHRFTLTTDIKVYFCDPYNPCTAWIERKHQRTSAVIFSQRHGSLWPHPSATQHRGKAFERKAEKDPKLRNTGQTI